MKNLTINRARIRRSQQGGWVMMEVILCLALFAVVLSVAQRQSTSHWQTIEYAQQQQKRADNQQKQTVMARLTGFSEWQSKEPDQDVAYPSCQICRGDQLAIWFQAALYSIAPTSDESDKGVSIP
ncbi:hypothetical protein J9B83_08455 [Marinomonas sp. A79]|uniref:Capsule biosynthesis GfcC-like N-terminal domain-containing protein n=1 Tax=Marinomonas vulgaris TaxID=2823372 RepID=A0ABS5HC64_9GAMM|nr:capsule biosynthesis GfcC D2 domain-containing protein [Marinomonas vulgaris]MBR7888978.1 hypothetical protein [Marinomonas vulgaris]